MKVLNILFLAMTVMSAAISDIVQADSVEQPSKRGWGFNWLGWGSDFTNSKADFDKEMTYSGMIVLYVYNSDYVFIMPGRMDISEFKEKYPTVRLILISDKNYERATGKNLELEYIPKTFIYKNHQLLTTLSTTIQSKWLKAVDSCLADTNSTSTSTSLSSSSSVSTSV